MAGFKSTYLCNKYLALLFNNTAYTPPTSVYFALYTVMPTASGGGTEVSGNGYARVAKSVAGTGQFAAPTAAVVSNLSIIDFGSPTGSGWGTIVGAGVFDASSGGNLLGASPLTPTKVGTAGLDFFIPIGGFVASEA